MRFRTIVGLGIVCCACAGCDRWGGQSPAGSSSHVTSSVRERHQDDQEEAVAGPVDYVELTPEQREFARLRVEPVGLRESRSVLSAMGKILAPQLRTAIVSHAFSARVSQILVNVGQWVEQGEPVVVLESHEVGEATTDFYKALADLELARVNVEREKEILDQGIGIHKNFAAAEAAFKIAQSTVEACEKKLHVLGFDEDQVTAIVETHQVSPKITLPAPISGRVVAIDSVLGSLIDETAEILRIIDTRRLVVAAEVLEKDISRVAAGMSIEIVVPAYPDEMFHAQLNHIGDLVDEASHAITVRGEVDNADGRLRPGMSADVKILLNDMVTSLVIPEAAVSQDGDAQVVFLQEATGFRRREIVAGPAEAGVCVVVSGLEDGERIVVEVNDLLRSVLLSDPLHAEDSP